ncbi:MAG: sigma-70 family RNA polymerase sigma factor [Firmicutes bacterium]|nr:sigma-70 family RNA polymerase sigma factor [Bacillota bacterium]
MAKILSLEETKNNLIAWRECGDEDALSALIVGNSRLVYYFATRFKGKGLTIDELKSAGTEALFNAINKFNYSEKPIEGFSSYISISIENGMRMELRKYNKHSHVLSFEQPIGQSKDGDDLKIEDLIGTDAEAMMNGIIADMKIEVVRDALQCLTTRERQIILLRYGLDEIHKKTQAEVAEMLGCSTSLISKQEQRALIKMRHPRNTRKLKDFAD